MWFFIAVLGYLLSAGVLILDKYILTNTVSKPVVYAFYSTIFMLAAPIALLFGGGLLRGSDWVWAAISGVAFGCGLWTMYIAVKDSEASHINPFIGAVVTIATLALATLILQETLAVNELGGVILLVVASLLLVREKRSQPVTFHTGFLWAIAAGVLFAISHVSAKYVYELYPFITAFVWTKASVGLVGVGLLASGSVRLSLAATRQKKNSHPVALVVTDKVLGVVAVVLIQYAAAIGSVTLVHALVGIQYAIMFVGILLLSRLAPRVFKEEFTRQELVIEIVALTLIMFGSALLVL